MLSIRKATIDDIPTIRKIAYNSWPSTYGHILSEDQLQYMLALFYSDESLTSQFVEKKHQFLLVNEGNISLGFAAYEPHYLNPKTTRLHKLYLLPEAQGKGVGRLLIETVVEKAKENGTTILSLNVNRFNKAVDFYLKMNFEIVAEEKLAVGQGYIMDDFKMEKKL